MTARTETQSPRNRQPDDSMPLDRHSLAGLEPDNLLAFMALVGLMRALETARPDWHPRTFWDTENQPCRPVLTLTKPQTEAAVARAAAQGVGKLARQHEVTGQHKNLKLTPAEFSALRDKANEQGLRLLDALCHPDMTDDKGKHLLATPFAFMFGQGHQHFLKRFREVPLTRLCPDVIAAALFLTWERKDRTGGFRWDPAEDRRHALRALDPSTEKATTQHGANVLAAIGLPLFPVIPVRRRGKTRLLTPMTRYGPDGKIEFTWPLWRRRSSLQAILALLRHPELARDRPEASNLPQSALLMRARRISPTEKYLNVSPAISLP